MPRALVMLYVTCVLLWGCCDRETKRLQPHWLRALEYEELTPISLLKSGEHSAGLPFSVSVGETTAGDPFSADVMDGFINPQRYGFWLDLTNKSARPIRLLWPEARYVDELGKAQTIFAKYGGGGFPNPDAMTPSGPPVIAPGQEAKLTIFPIYKSYWTSDGCFSELVPFREPLIPTNLSDLKRFPDEASVKKYVDDLAKRKVPVKLILPMEIEGKRYDYAFTFVLRERWADLPKQ